MYRVFTPSGNGKQKYNGNGKQKYYANGETLIYIKIIFMTIIKVIKGEGINQSGLATMEEFKGNR